MLCDIRKEHLKFALQRLLRQFGWTQGELKTSLQVEGMACLWESLGGSGKDTVLYLDALPCCKHALQDGMNIRKPDAMHDFQEVFSSFWYSVVNPPDDVICQHLHGFVWKSGTLLHPLIIGQSSSFIIPINICISGRPTSHLQTHPNIIWLVNWILYDHYIVPLYPHQIPITWLFCVGVNPTLHPKWTLAISRMCDALEPVIRSDPCSSVPGTSGAKNLCGANSSDHATTW